MNRYVVLLGLVILAIAQVAWAGFLLWWGNILPLVLIYLWIILPMTTFEERMVYAFIGGVVIDLLSSSLLGAHALTLLICVGVLEYLHRKTVVATTLNRLVSIVVVTLIYIGITRLLTRM